MKYTLSSSVEFNGVEYKELTFREATTGDLMAADMLKGETSQLVAVLASISDVPLPAFKKIKARELKNIVVLAADLLGEPSEPGTATE